MVKFHPEIWLPIILYAETHYKFKGIYSRLFKKEPEIIADAPFRVEPGESIPILLLIKDAHKFPVEILGVTIRVRIGERNFTTSHPLNISLNSERFWYQIIHLELPDGLHGLALIDVEFRVKIQGKIKIYHNDNYRISSHEPLKIYLSGHPLPRFDGWYFGDFHYHSNYTEDMVEFGAPLEATVKMAQTCGINFFAVTDHSYDLDDREDSWLENDPEIPKWYAMKKEVALLNKKYSDFIVLPAEEVSAGNWKGRNVHLLIINNNQFFEGKGDGAERWLKTEPNLTIQQILAQLESKTLAIAGHPEMKTPFLQRLLIRRGQWGWNDFQHPLLHGFQIWNGELDRAFYRGSKMWMRLLLEGKQLSLIAGNDAHGNFNRFRQIGFPFFTFREQQTQIFGLMRTAVRIEGQFNLDNLIDAVKNRHVVVTNGPLIEMTVKNERGEQVWIGGKLLGRKLRLHLKVKSSPEFGAIKKITLLIGDLQLKKELPFNIFKSFPQPYFYEKVLAIPSVASPFYLRAEVDAETVTHQKTRCMSNPIWVKIAD